MPWEKRDAMSLRMQFVMRLQSGERMTDLCEEYGISRRIGYKFAARYEKHGAEGLRDQSRAPKRSPQRIAPEIAAELMQMRKKHSGWGGRKLKQVLETQRPEVEWPAASSIDDLLKRNGLVGPRHGRKGVPKYGDGMLIALAPNHVWCTDYKGEFRTGDGRYCYPLTLTDRFSRAVLGCEAFERINTDEAMEAFHEFFAEHGLPDVIRSDNGTPFAARSLWGLSRLSVWWMRLKIWHERIAPGQPQQNGQHERMHLDLKRATTRPAAKNALAQQERFDAFREEFNNVRPHEALAMKTPSEVYVPSLRMLPAKLEDPTYPLHDDTLRLDAFGQLRIGRRNFALAVPLANELVGIREISDDEWLISFLDFDLGIWTPSDGFQPAAAPSAPPRQEAPDSGDQGPS